MNDFEKVGKVSDFEEGQGRAVPVDDRMVAVFRKGDQWYAIDDLCPHMGASLAEGYVDEHTVTCPWHALAILHQRWPVGRQSPSEGGLF